MERQVLEGCCLCGKVRYEYTGDITEIAMCHCAQCRRAQGSAFAINCPVDSRKLSFTGLEHIREYQSAENKTRAFCRHCGSPLYSERSDLPGIKRLRLGAIESGVACENRYHIHTASKASWYEINDEFPQYDEGKDA